MFITLTCNTAQRVVNTDYITMILRNDDGCAIIYLDAISAPSKLFTTDELFDDVIKMLESPLIVENNIENFLFDSPTVNMVESEKPSKKKKENNDTTV